MSSRDVVLQATERIDIGDDTILAFRVHHSYREQVASLIEYVEGRKKVTQYRLEVGPVRRRRTSGPRSQNSRIYGHLSVIAEETGNDLDDLKVYIGTRAMRRGYPPRRDEDGNILYSLLTGDPLPEHTSKVTVEQATLLIEEINQTAAELGIQLPEYAEEGVTVYG